MGGVCLDLGPTGTGWGLVDTLELVLEMWNLTWVLDEGAGTRPMRESPRDMLVSPRRKLRETSSGLRLCLLQLKTSQRTERWSESPEGTGNK